MAAYIPSHESGEVNIPKATIHRARLKRIIVLAYTHQEGGGGGGGGGGGEALPIHSLK